MRKINNKFGKKPYQKRRRNRAGQQGCQMVSGEEKKNDPWEILGKEISESQFGEIFV